MRSGADELLDCSLQIFLYFVLFQMHNYQTLDRQLSAMFNFPFYNMMIPNDPFDHQLASAYEPSYPFQLEPTHTLKPDLPKVEEGTSPGYTVQAPAEIPKLDLNEIFTRNEKSKGKRSSKRRNDDDYRPYKRVKATKGIVKQKEDRNLIPNTVHHLLAFVQKQFKSHYLVEQIFKGVPHDADYTIARFYNYHKMLRIKINNYVNEEAMKIITELGSLDFHEYDENEQRFYCLVSRILIKKFLKMEAVLMILLSKKVRKENILDHLSVQRYLFENMRAEDTL